MGDSPNARCRVIVTMNRGDAASPRRGEPLELEDLAQRGSGAPAGGGSLRGQGDAARGAVELPAVGSGNGAAEAEPVGAFQAGSGDAGW